MFNKEMAFENEKFSEVRNFLNNEIIRLQHLIEDYKEEIKTQGSDFNRDNPNGGMYSGMELTQIHYDMEKKMVDSQIAKDDIYFYSKLIKSPYFARVDFCPDGSNSQRTVYIGLRTLQDPKTFKTYVCDWRAPISSLFYDEFEDKAFFEAPRGTIYGDLLLKRQYKFIDGKLDSFINCDIKIDDDILRDVLSSASGENLKVIVNSIQREQNKVVRYSDKENLLVTGPAGSGKTSVGFHRLAFLLYRNRTELSSSEIVMFSNNDIFSGYVADIIPELGELPINYASFDGIFKAEIPEYRVENFYGQAEEILKGNDELLLCAKEKTSEEFLRYLDNSVKEFKPSFKDISFYGFSVLSAKELRERYDSCEGAPGTRGEALVRYTDAVITNTFEDNKDIIENIIYAENEGSDEDELRMVKRETREFKQAVFQSLRDCVIPHPVKQYFKVLKKYAQEKKLPALTKSEKSLKDGVISFSDGLGIVYLKTAFDSAAVLSGVKHILIDEAQDYSLIQHSIIKRMFPRAKFTVLADTNQAILGEINLANEELLANVYDAKIRRLNKSYRSSKEINAFALSLLPEDKRYDIFDRTGLPVEEIKVDFEAFREYLTNRVADKQPLCIITKTTEQAKKLYETLSQDFPGFSLCCENSGNISGDYHIIPLAYTKGLEFPNVLVYNENGSFSGEENKKYLYLASTRALHRLTICN